MGSFCIFSPTVFWNIGAFASKGSRGQCLGWQCRSRPTASSGLKKPGHKRLPQHRIPATSRWGPARPQYCLVLSCTYIHMYVYMIYIYICMYIYSREIQLVAKKCNMLVFVFSLRTANIAAEILHVHGIILILTYITPAAPPSTQNPKSVKLVFVLCLGTWRILQSWNHQMEGAMFASNSTENSWSMLPIWLLAAMMIMMYYWRFWEPWANAMSAILLPKLWIENHDWHNCFWMSCWGSPLLDQKKLQNQQFYKID